MLTQKTKDTVKATAPVLATGVRAFISPNIFIFTTTLVVSLVLMVPGPSGTAIGTFLCLGAVASLGYLAYTRAHRQWRHNKLSYPDWIWYVGLPPTGYVLLLLSGIGFLLQAAGSMHGVAAALILLLMIGIRNAWDLVIFMTQREQKQADQPDAK
jgi:hypothetical protein